jgi:hypothetical protein
LKTAAVLREWAYGQRAVSKANKKRRSLPSPR